MAPPPSNSQSCARQACFVFLLLSIAALAAAAPSSYSSHCSSLPPAADRHTDVVDDAELLSSINLPNGFISGAGADILFSPDSGVFNDRSFSFIPTAVSRTADPALIHLTATLTLFGYRVHNDKYEYDGGTERLLAFPRVHSIFFHLDGYYSTASAELCMVGAGTEHAAAAGSVKHYADAALHLRVPSPPSLTDPFVTGRLEGAGFQPVSLVTYAEGDAYRYSGRASCPPTTPEAPATARRALQPQNSSFSCSALTDRLVTKYRLEYGKNASAASLPWLRAPRMNVNQVRCGASGAVRVYAVFSNDTSLWSPWDRFSVEEQAVVADGFWDSATSRLCLSACRVARSSAPGASASASATENNNLEVRECGISMSFWFPAVWTFRDRSVTAGSLWDGAGRTVGDNTSHASVVVSSPIRASSFTKIISDNLSDMKYKYNDTMIETARRHYLSTGLIKDDKKIKAPFPGNNTYSYRDFEFLFFVENATGTGRAYPASIGSAMVDGEKLAAESSFVRHALPEMEKSRPVNVSYFILSSVLPPNWISSIGFGGRSHRVPFEHERLQAEGVYDTKTGYLTMVACRELNGSTDCQVLITVHFTSLDADRMGFGAGKGRISSLRDSADELYFEARDIILFGTYSGQASDSIWRMGLESLATVASTTLSCVLAVLQILHTKRNRDAAPATSLTMLAVMALGHAAPLVVNLDALLGNRRDRFVQLSDNGGLLELNEMMLRAPAVIALVLQLRLLQLAWSARGSDAGGESKAAERSALRVCLPLYLAGGAVAGMVHLVNNRAARGSLVVRLGPAPATLWQGLASYAGLLLDGFLLPQVVLNAFSGSGARAISPWFYVGGTAIRVAPHLYDAARARSYVPSVKPSYMYASPSDGLFGAAWDVVVPCGAVSLALLLFLQQRQGGDFSRRSRSRPGGYQMVSSFHG